MGKHVIDWAPLGRKHYLPQEAQCRMRVGAAEAVQGWPSGRSVRGRQSSDSWSLSFPNALRSMGPAGIKNPHGHTCSNGPSPTPRHAGGGVKQHSCSLMPGGTIIRDGQSGGRAGGFLPTERILYHMIQQTLLGVFPNEPKLYVQTKTCTWMLTAAFFVITQTQEQPRGASLGEWIGKQWSVQTVEYDSALKVN